jgi:hypothetical protein
LLDTAVVLVAPECVNQRVRDACRSITERDESRDAERRTDGLPISLGIVEPYEEIAGKHRFHHGPVYAPPAPPLMDDRQIGLESLPLKVIQRDLLLPRL